MSEFSDLPQESLRMLMTMLQKELDKKAAAAVPEPVELTGPTSAVAPTSTVALTSAVAPTSAVALTSAVAPGPKSAQHDAAANRTAGSVASSTGSSVSGVQMKKPLGQDVKKVAHEEAAMSEDASSGASSTPGRNTPSQKMEDDVYEFKTTPKDSTSGGNSSDDGSTGKIDLGSGGKPGGGADKAAPEEKSSGEDPSVPAPGSAGATVSVASVGGGAAATSGNIPGGGQQKRPYQDMEVADDVGGDDETKRKKRKDSETLTKEAPPGKAGTPARMPQRPEKTTKPPGGVPKSTATVTATKPTSNIERKSPCASPKPQVPQVGTSSGAAGIAAGLPGGNTAAGNVPGGTGKPPAESDSETGDEATAKTPGIGAETFSASGPKVPPLKIVIPQQNSSADQEPGLRNGKNASTRNHPALPYVVASSNNSNEATDKESSSPRCASPTDAAVSGSGKPPSGEEKKTFSGTTTASAVTAGVAGNSAAAGGTTSASGDDRAQPRVLRSSHRTGGASGGSNGQTTDRGSNNSSPQMQNSASPSPAPPSTTSTMEAGGSSTSGGATGGGSNAGSGTTSTTGNLANGGGGTNSPTNANASVSGSASETDGGGNAPSPSSATSSTSSSTVQSQNTVELHPRKRKIRASKDDSKTVTNSGGTGVVGGSSGAGTSGEHQESVSSTEVHPHDQPITNCYQMYLNIRKQIERRQKNLFLVQPKPPQGFKDYLMNRCTYVLAGKTSTEPTINYPATIPGAMKEQFAGQEKERHKLKMQHVVEKEKLVLAVEQEILRVHGRAARALANQSLPFSVCTILKDEEVYNMLTPEQEEKDRNARSRYNGRLFLSWLQDVDDKWEKIKEAMLLRHHNEAESLHAVQKMEWESKMKELSLCEFNAKPAIEDLHVPMVHVSDDFDLLPP
uniref:Uncharacterized protein n=1 Tax=Lutzomyia longipalpis TaxID=7200 RepID=A0A7G3B1E7_LUTLO